MSGSGYLLLLLLSRSAPVRFRVRSDSKALPPRPAASGPGTKAPASPPTRLGPQTWGQKQDVKVGSDPMINIWDPAYHHVRNLLLGIPF